jgi:hypothetical protein
MVLERVKKDFIQKVGFTPDGISAELSKLDQQQREALKLERQYLRDASKARRDELANASRYVALDGKFPRIDMSFLSNYVEKQGSLLLPKLAVFTPECNVATLWYQAGWLGGLRSNRVSVLDFQSLAMSCSMSELAQKEKLSQVIVKAWWGGVIPSESRAIVKQTRKHFDEVLIVAEVAEWNVEKTPNNLLRLASAARDSAAEAGSRFLAAIGDPLVIGRKGDVFWLVHEFDTTSLEEHIGHEFTQG